MDQITRVKQETNLLIYGKSKSKLGNTLYEIADHVGKTSSYLSRIASLSEEVPFPIDLALKIMQLKKDTRFMSFLASEMDGVFVKLPKFKQSKQEESEMTINYQKAATEATSAFLDFIFNPNEAKLKECEEKLNKIIELSVNAKIYIKKKASNQLELL